MGCMARHRQGWQHSSQAPAAKPHLLPPPPAQEAQPRLGLPTEHYGSPCPTAPPREGAAVVLSWPQTKGGNPHPLPHVLLCVVGVPGRADCTP